MSALDVLSMCLRNLLKRKLRTLLTMLGVIIGTAALVLTMSLGLASDARFDRMMDEMGQDMTMISVWTQGNFMVIGPDGPVVPEGVLVLDDYMIDSFERIPGVVVASPRMWGSLVLASGPYQMWASITGVRAEALPLMGLNLAEGRLINESDQHAAVFGFGAETGFTRAGDTTDWMLRREWRFRMGEDVETVIDVFNDPIIMSYDSRLAWGGMEEVDFEEVFRPITTMNLNVVGLLEPSGDPWNDLNIYMDIDTLVSLDLLRQEAERENAQEWGTFSARIAGPRQEHTEAFVRVETPDDAERVANIIQEMGFQTHYPGAWIDMMRDQQQGIQNLLIGIAAVSIFVAAISIANTMIMAVYERTREIGVMKVIGGAIRDIRHMFLLEAALIGFLGGVFGVGLSLLLSHLLNTAGMGIVGDQMGGWMQDPTDVTSLITPWLCGVALIFASVVGLISGYFPALRATKLSALAAIRTD